MCLCPNAHVFVCVCEWRLLSRVCSEMPEAVGKTPSISHKFSCVYTLYSFRRVTSGLRRPFPLACAVGHAAIFAVNAALVTSWWQHRAWSVPLQPPINAEHEVEQGASTVFQVFGTTRRGIEPSLPVLVASARVTWAMLHNIIRLHTKIAKHNWWTSWQGSAERCLNCEIFTQTLFFAVKFF